MSLVQASGSVGPLLCALMLVACGARTGLVVARRGVDAGVGDAGDAGDAGVDANACDTEPCLCAPELVPGSGVSGSTCNAVNPPGSSCSDGAAVFFRFTVPPASEVSLSLSDNLMWGGLDFAMPSFQCSNVSMNDRNDLCNVPCFEKELVARVRASLPSDEELEEARVIFSALADKTRLKVLHALRSGEELCVCDVAHVLDMSVSAASHHLRKLRDLRILKHRNDGKMAYYSLRDRFVGDLVKRALTKVAA